MRWRLCEDAHDLEVWARLHHECMPYDDAPPAHHRRWLGCLGDRVVAVLAADWLPVDRAVYLSLVAVCESARGRRIQRRAIRHVESWAREHGAGGVISYTHSQNVASMASFIACGYRPYLPEVAWVGRDPRWVYWRRLLPAAHPPAIVKG